MRAPLTIAVAQPPCISHDVAANAVTHAATVRAAGAGVVVFPELSLTGYELAADLISPEDARLWPIVEACADTGALALAGAPVAGPHIGMLAIDGDGARVVYRKQHLGGAEPERFRPGPEPVVLAVHGWRLGLAICRDTGVPRHAADTAALGMDVYVAGVVHEESELTEQERRARRVASEHGVPVAMASCAGATGGGFDHCAGHSTIWAADGSVLAAAGPETGAVVSARLSGHG
ncbi:carbon-nitrogen hydrolase family protein [Crossiella sp. NPDC003009]